MIESVPYVKAKLKIIYDEHFLFRCSNLQHTRDKLLRNLYQKDKSLKNKTVSYQCRKILTLNFKKKNICETVAKDVHNMYTVRKELEAERLKERSRRVNLECTE